MRKTRFSLIDKLFGLIENNRASDRLLMRLLFFIVLIFGILFIISLNDKYNIITPTNGGSLVEGIIGTPRFINPALAISRADQDATALIYDGLLKIGQTGELEPNIAEKFAVSEDGLTYNLKLRNDRFFHDGVLITANDVLFTINLIKDPDLKSPLRGNWTDANVQVISDTEIEITLKEAYSPFIENFTTGIMPKHVWENIPTEQIPFSKNNTEPIGSGPFAIKNIERDDTGIIKGYTLEPNPHFIPKANLEEVKLLFFQNEEQLLKAFNEKSINSTVYLPTNLIKDLDTEKTQIISEPLPRIFGIFFNQNRSPALRDASVRQALNTAIDRTIIIDQTLDGFGVPSTKAILFTEDGIKSNDTDLTTSPSVQDRSAEDILIAGGWKKNDSGVWEKEIDKSVETLSITIKTSNSDLFDKVANLVAKSWREIGVEVKVEQYEQTGLVQSVIRPRDFQALLFGLDMNRTQDPYPFWHSSQKDDPGLNVSQYTNISIDRLLEEARTSTDEVRRQEILIEISKTLEKEVPAIFLFAPNLNYVVDKDIKITPITKLSRPSDRFANISNWHAKTETLWPIFHD